jgi:hypothetical protein
MKTQDLNHFAIIVELSKDNVAVAKHPLQRNMSLRLGNKTLTLKENIGVGERFALQNIMAGDAVFQFGYPFGTSAGINIGERISSANVIARLPKRIYKKQKLTPLPRQSGYEALTFRGGIVVQMEVAGHVTTILLCPPLCVRAQRPH